MIFPLRLTLFQTYDVIQSSFASSHGEVYNSDEFVKCIDEDKSKFLLHGVDPNRRPSIEDDPLSLYLFIILAEVLGWGLKHSQSQVLQADACLQPITFPICG